jgi:hypothetical protein
MSDKINKAAKDLDEIQEALESSALTMRSCTVIGQFEFHANEQVKMAKKIRKVIKKITGHGTGHG